MNSSLKRIVAVLCRPMLLILTGLCLLSPRSGLANNASPDPVQLVQPDGTPITLRIRGDAFFHWHEDMNGYTVVINNGQYVYAKLDANNRLAPTQWVVGKDNPQTAGLSAGILPPPSTVQAIKARFSPGVGTVSVPRPIAASGTVSNLVVLCKFSDHTFGVQTRVQSDYDTLMNKVGGDPTLAPTGSLRDYYNQASYGIVTIQSTVVAWVTLPHTEAYYANGQTGFGDYPQNAQGMVEDALKLVDAFVDFGQFDHDNDGYVDAIDIIHSGYAAETGGGAGNWIWSHKWALFELPGGQFTSSHKNSQGVNVKVYNYHTEAALWGTSGNAILRVGVIAHETGHFFGLPDLYDVGSVDPVGEGIGSYCLMANSWGFDGTQYHPPIMSAWSKMQLGWVTPTVINNSGTYTAPQSITTPTIFQITNGYPSGEYLLIENRQPSGFESDMPQGGLAIWHVDENQSFNNEFPGYPGMSGWPNITNHYHVALLQADGKYDLEKGNNRGDSGDVYRGGGVSLLSTNTVPNTAAYQNGIVINTSNTISSISVSGASMTFVYGNGSGAITPSLSISSASVLEGNSGTTPIVSTVTLSQAASTAVTVTWVTSNGTATAGVDYQAGSNNLTFPIGTTSLTVTNFIIANTNLQANRIFYVNLSNPSGATVLAGQATMTIVDDDAALDLTVVQETNALNLASAILTSGTALQIKSAAFSGNTMSNGVVTSSGLYFLNGAGPHTYGLTLPGVVLSSGNVMDYQSGPNTIDGLSTEYGVPATAAQEVLLDVVTGTTNYQHYDAAQLDVYFDAPAGSNQITFLVVFGSEEYPDFVNSPYVDAFGIFLNGTNIAYSSGLPINIDHPDFTAVSGTELNGVLAPGGNPVLQFSTLVAPGSTNNRLTFIVADTSDDELDTTVYISSLQATKPPPPVYLSIQNAGVIEGNSGITNMVFPVTLSTVATQTVSVQFSTANGTAAAGQDYYATNGTLTFAPGVTNLFVTVPVMGDTLNEADESLYVVLLNPVNGILQNSTAVGVITNDDPVTTIVSVDTPAPVLEGNSGTTNLQFLVRLSQPSGQIVRVNYATGGGTATPGLDYVSASGQLFFPPGVQTQYVNVTVKGDTLYEGNETVVLSLNSPTNALLSLSAYSATGTIIDDDLPPSITVTGAKVFEGDSGTNNAFVTLTLSAPSAVPITAYYSTSNGVSAFPALAGSDYVAVSNSLVTFGPGVTNLLVPIGIIGDLVDEPNEDFQVWVTSSVQVSGSPATVIIVNDDGPLLTITGAQMYEGNSGTNLMVFPVTLTQPTNATVTVDYYTVDGTATVADNDYVSTNGTVTFAPNQTNATITVQIIGDTKPELNEKFQVVLTNASVATIAVDTADGVILDDDTLADLKLTSVAPSRGYVGIPVPVTLTVTNQGTFGATNAVLTLICTNPNISFASATVSQGTISNNNGTLTMQLGNMTNGATATANISLLASRTGTTAFQAFALADQYDSNLLDNTNSFSVQMVVPIVDIEPVDRVLLSESGPLKDGALQPGETVSISFVITNQGTIGATNLVGTLLATDGVTLPGPAQNYGAVTNGGAAVARTFTFTVDPAAVGSITAFLDFTDGGVEVGSIIFELPVSGTTQFASPNPINTPDHGPATNGYPSIIHVTGLSGLVTKVTATLSNVAHTYPADFDILLVSPAGDKVLIMSDAGGGISVSNVNLTFDDAASGSLSQSGPLISGVFKPTNYGDGDTFPSGPVAPFGSNMAAFNSHDPNGDWKLYVVDDGVGDIGGIIGGWSLSIQTADTINPNANLSLTVIPSLPQVRVGSNLVYTITVSNAGPASATSVRFTNVLGAGAALISSNITAGTLSVSGGTVIGDLGTLSSNGVSTISLTVQPLLYGTLTNLATVFAPQVDLQPQDNVSLLTTRVDRLDLLTVPPGGFSNGVFSLSLDAAGGVTYVIQASTNLVDWVSIYTNTSFSGAIQFSDPNANTNQVRFYRAIEQ